LRILLEVLFEAAVLLVKSHSVRVSVRVRLRTKIKVRVNQSVEILIKGV
jgi:hypothetical protein